MKGKARVHAGVLFLEAGEDRFVLVADELQGAELVVIAYKILAPVAGADDGDAWLIHELFSVKVVQIVKDVQVVEIGKAMKTGKRERRLKTKSERPNLSMTSCMALILSLLSNRTSCGRSLLGPK